MLSRENKCIPSLPTPQGMVDMLLFFLPILEDNLRILLNTALQQPLTIHHSRPIRYELFPIPDLEIHQSSFQIMEMLLQVSQFRLIPGCSEGQKCIAILFKENLPNLSNNG